MCVVFVCVCMRRAGAETLKYRAILAELAGIGKKVYSLYKQENSNFFAKVKPIRKG